MFVCKFAADFNFSKNQGGMADIHLTQVLYFGNTVESQSNIADHKNQVGIPSFETPETAHIYIADAGPSLPLVKIIAGNGPLVFSGRK